MPPKRSTIRSIASVAPLRGMAVPSEAERLADLSPAAARDRRLGRPAGVRQRHLGARPRLGSQRTERPHRLRPRPSRRSCRAAGARSYTRAGRARACRASSCAPPPATGAGAASAGTCASSTGAGTRPARTSATDAAPSARWRPARAASGRSSSRCRRWSTPRARRRGALGVRQPPDQADARLYAGGVDGEPLAVVRGSIPTIASACWPRRRPSPSRAASCAASTACALATATGCGCVTTPPRSSASTASCCSRACCSTSTDGRAPSGHGARQARPDPGDHRQLAARDLRQGPSHRYHAGQPRAGGAARPGARAAPWARPTSSCCPSPRPSAGARRDQRVLRLGAARTSRRSCWRIDGRERAYLVHRFPLRESRRQGLRRVRDRHRHHRAQASARTSCRRSSSGRCASATRSTRTGWCCTPSRSSDLATGRAGPGGAAGAHAPTTDGGLVMPGVFLPPAERFGLIPAIDRWVVAQAARHGPRPRASRSTSRARAWATTRSRVHRGRAPRRRRRPAATSSSRSPRPPPPRTSSRPRRLAERLSALGCGFALDDFGTGYGSFTYLKHLPVDYIKIDMEFVRDLTPDSADRQVVKAIIDVARKFGIRDGRRGRGEPGGAGAAARAGRRLRPGLPPGRPAPLEPLRARSTTLGLRSARTRPARAATRGTLGHVAQDLEHRLGRRRACRRPRQRGGPDAPHGAVSDRAHHHARMDGGERQARQQA